MPFLAFNNGDSIDRVAPDTLTGEGEALFEEFPTEVQLVEAFPGRGVRPDLALQARAQELLAVSDIQVIRCAEDGVAVPQAWKDYRAQLRLIVTTGVGEIPARPAFPT